MACIDPNYITQRIDPDTGCVTTKFCGSLGLLDPREFDTSYDVLASGGVRTVLVPCGKCIGCRSDQSAEWTKRMAIEFLDNDCRAIFVTLTYDNDNVPVVESDYGMMLTLDKRDPQLFLKRLRKHFSGTRIRYVLTGEYGDNTQRPHYHAIIYGLTLDDFNDVYVHHYNDVHQPVFASPTLSRLWSYGYVTIGAVSQYSLAYVSRYTLKKLSVTESPDFFDTRQPVYMLMSRRPGIGYLRADDYVYCPDKICIPYGDTLVHMYVPQSVKKKGAKVLDMLPDVLYNNNKDNVGRDPCHGYDSYGDYAQATARRLRRLKSMRKDVI